MKLLIIAAMISLVSSNSFAERIYGGDMPFPIGKIIDFPKDDGKGVWKDDLNKDIFRLKTLKGEWPKGSILVQMLGIQKKVIAEGVGKVDQDKILRARLQYISNKDKVVFVSIANLCADPTFDNYTDYSTSCDQPEMWASIVVHEKNQKFKGSEQFVIRKTARKEVKDN